MGNALFLLRFVTVDTFVHFLGWYQAGRIGRWGERVAGAVCVPDRAVSRWKEGEGGRSRQACRESCTGGVSGWRMDGAEGVTAGGLPGYGGACVRGCGRCGGHEKRPRRWVPVSAGVFFQSGKGMG